MTPLQRYTRRHHIRLLAKEIHNAAACLNASQAAICHKTGLKAERWKALAYAHDRVGWFNSAIIGIIASASYAGKSGQAHGFFDVL